MKIQNNWGFRNVQIRTYGPTDWRTPDLRISDFGTFKFGLADLGIRNEFYCCSDS
jgi:hypothetical protein